MDRNTSLARMRAARTPFDVVIVGGGATGLGCAVDAAARGLNTALVERGDIAHGTSSRSSKMIHGGVRYLRSGQLGLVAHSLAERAVLRRLAPGLVHGLPFLVPAYHRGERAFYGAGLFLYDALAGGDREHERTRILSARESLATSPGLRAAGLRGGVLYHDDQFDDARLAVALARTASHAGAAIATYVQADALLTTGDRVTGIAARDLETGATCEIPARVVINATGTATDALRLTDDPAATPMMRASRGTHVVLDASFLPGGAAVMLPRTDDGRVLFLIPWRGWLMIGTTDTMSAELVDEPAPGADDVAFLLDHAARYLARTPRLADVRSCWAGLRPLTARGNARTASLRRDHHVLVSARGLVTVTGGKWTTYRRMAEDAVDHAIRAGGLCAGASRTRSLKLEGADGAPDPVERYLQTGAPAPDAASVDAVTAFARECVRTGMARTAEDVLARRSRALFLDVERAAALGEGVIRAMADELGRDGTWMDTQRAALTEAVRRFRPPGTGAGR